MLYREPKLLKVSMFGWLGRVGEVSVLYREPKLLKEVLTSTVAGDICGFSALP